VKNMRMRILLHLQFLNYFHLILGYIIVTIIIVSCSSSSSGSNIINNNNSSSSSSSSMFRLYSIILQPST
jgi:hypothetical protein